MIAQQHVPSGHRLRMTGGLASTPVDDASALCCAAEDIGARIDRMPEDLQHRVVGRRPPFDLAHAAVVTSGNRQLQRLILRPKQDLPGRLPSSWNLSNKSRMTPATRSSGSISIWPISFQQ